MADELEPTASDEKPVAEVAEAAGHNYSAEEIEGLREQVVDALKMVFDPEIPVNIYDLGLIYDIRIDSSGFADLDMTLTAPGCPVAQTFPQTVQDAVCTVDGITDAKVELVREPPWTQELMSETARYQLNMF